MAIVKLVLVTCAAGDWEETGSIARDDIGFDVSNSGLSLYLRLSKPHSQNSLGKKSHKLDVGSVAQITIEDPQGPFKCTFENAILVGKQAMHTGGEVPNPLIAAVSNPNTYPGIIQLEFHVGPVFER